MPTRWIRLQGKALLPDTAPGASGLEVCLPILWCFSHRELGVSFPPLESGQARHLLVTQCKWHYMTSETRSQKTTHFPHGSLGMLKSGGSQKPCKRSDCPETTRWSHGREPSWMPSVVKSAEDSSPRQHLSVNAQETLDEELPFPASSPTGSASLIKQRCFVSPGL